MPINEELKLLCKLKTNTRCITKEWSRIPGERHWTISSRFL